MSKKPYSRTNIWGDIEHFDENGKKIGESRKSIFKEWFKNLWKPMLERMVHHLQDYS